MLSEAQSTPRIKSHKCKTALVLIIGESNFTNSRLNKIVYACGAISMNVYSERKLQEAIGCVQFDLITCDLGLANRFNGLNVLQSTGYLTQGGNPVTKLYAIANRDLSVKDREGYREKGFAEILTLPEDFGFIKSQIELSCQASRTFRAQSL